MTSARGRAACNGCRARKQKCDEKRPSCSRCVDIGRTCVWSRLQKRGPAKGYVEALEHRLATTEMALLRVCRRADARLLQEAFGIDGNTEAQGEPRLPRTSGGSGRADVKKASEFISQWESLPLSTAEDLKRWVEAMSQQPKLAITSPSDGNNGNRLPALTREESPPHDREEVAEVSQVARSTPLKSRNLDDATMATTDNQAMRDSLDISQDFKLQYLW